MKRVKTPFHHRKESMSGTSLQHPSKASGMNVLLIIIHFSLNNFGGMLCQTLCFENCYPNKIRFYLVKVFFNLYYIYNIPQFSQS